jgi:hypothetical protein
LIVAKKKPPKTVDEKILEKLEHIEAVLQNLTALQGCAADANSNQLASWIGIGKGRVSDINGILKAGRKKSKSQ